MGILSNSASSRQFRRCIFICVFRILSPCQYSCQSATKQTRNIISGRLILSNFRIIPSIFLKFLSIFRKILSKIEIILSTRRNATFSRTFHRHNPKFTSHAQLTARNEAQRPCPKLEAHTQPKKKTTYAAKA